VILYHYDNILKLFKTVTEDIKMTVREIVSILDAKLYAGEDKLDMQVNSACASDMMSDVLAYVKDQSVLLTGLVNPQVIRTAEMMDMHCVVFTRGKTPDSAITNLAKEKDICLLSTNMRMYPACGMLYLGGLRGGSVIDGRND
jgi:predicted transcriptional regulator